MAKTQAEKQSMSLNTAQDFAFQNNKNLQNAKSDVLITYKQIREVRGSGQPQAYGTVGYMTNFNYAFSFGGFGGGGKTIPNIDYSVLDAGDTEVMKFLSELFRYPISTKTYSGFKNSFRL